MLLSSIFSASRRCIEPHKEAVAQQQRYIHMRPLRRVVSTKVAATAANAKFLQRLHKGKVSEKEDPFNSG